MLGSSSGSSNNSNNSSNSTKDPAIKLFGKTIPLPSNEEIKVSAEYVEECSDDDIDFEEEQLHEKKKDPSGKGYTDIKVKQGSVPLPSEELADPISSVNNENPKTPSVEKEAGSTKGSRAEEEQTLQTARTDTLNGIHHPTVKPNGTILTFGSDTPLCESMASVLNIADKTMRNCSSNGFQKPEEQRNPVSCGGESGDENSNRSCVTGSSSTEEGRMVGLQEPMMQNINGFSPQMPCFPGGPWPYPWNSAQWNTAVPPPSFCPSNYPISFFPAPTYWGCPIPGAWSIPWISPPSSSPNNGAPCSGPNSPLGKHSREGDMLKPGNSEKEDPPKHSGSVGGVWIPKTLRIDDPGEAARSSIWATLGIKNDKSDSFNGGRLFKAFQSKGDEKNHVDENSQVMHANPAAMSRSLNFQESS
ncbi:hypothetical protein IFM89_031343 [Coptis chinensis]|uniref:Uncharacterized protein n=1 Tax=Coptis chinensis TaxID=261450 RepID=A0A835MJR4_9MAGN|nr:hypothetical protein IFM89_031343 [Coptis chinensis]